MEIPQLTITPDRHLPVRYAGASGDFNPIHFDAEHARQVGLPGTILHGLYSMAEVARSLTLAGGGPGSLRELSVQFRGMAFPESEITVTSTVIEQTGSEVSVRCEATQDGRTIIRNGEATIVPT